MEDLSLLSLSVRSRLCPDSEKPSFGVKKNSCKGKNFDPNKIHSTIIKMLIFDFFFL